MLFYPVVFPSLPYFGQVIKQGNWKILADFTYQKSLHCNRYVVPLMNKDVVLSVPLKKFVKGTRFSDLEISYAENWVRVHLGTLRAGYGKAPYFEYYYDLIEKAYTRRPVELLSLARELNEGFAGTLRIRPNWVEALPEATPIFDESRKAGGAGIEYRQVFEPLRAHCKDASVMDLLMNCGPDALWVMGSGMA